MKIENGWRLSSADFSLQAADKSKVGYVSLIRDADGRKKWHGLSDELKDSDDCPSLFIMAEGENIEAAIINANLKASHTKPLPETHK